MNEIKSALLELADQYYAVAHDMECRAAEMMRSAKFLNEYADHLCTENMRVTRPSPDSDGRIMTSLTYSVYPRYSCCFPGLVNEQNAKQVATHEVHAYYNFLKGLGGEECKIQAEELGLRGIVELHEIYAHHIDYYDMLTGEYGKLEHIEGKPTRVPIQGPPKHHHPRWEISEGKLVFK